MEQIEPIELIEPIEFDSGREIIEFEFVPIGENIDKGTVNTKVQNKAQPFGRKEPMYPLTTRSISLLPAIDHSESDSYCSKREGQVADTVTCWTRKTRLKFANCILPTCNSFKPKIFKGQESFSRLDREVQGTKFDGNVSPEEVGLVVSAIKGIGQPVFKKGDLTRALKNKKLKAKDIERVLSFLVDNIGALKSLGPSKATTGRPSFMYEVLWGESAYFPLDDKPPLHLEER